MRSQTLLVMACHRDPLGGAQGIFRLTVLSTSRTKIFCGSLALISFQRAWPKTQIVAALKHRKAPTNIIAERGGKDFFSGTLAASRTFTLGISLASATLASSYSWVRVSKTASSTFERRYKSA